MRLIQQVNFKTDPDVLERARKHVDSIGVTFQAWLTDLMVAAMDGQPAKAQPAQPQHELFDRLSRSTDAQSKAIMTLAREWALRNPPPPSPPPKREGNVEEKRRKTGS